MKANIFVPIVFMFIAGFGSADEFTDLAKQQVKASASDPFQNRKAYCVAKDSKNYERGEKWTFFSDVKTGAKTYFKELKGFKVIIRGTYSVSGGVLTTTVPATSKTFAEKFKILGSEGWQYIDNKGEEKLLYSCSWL